MLEVMVSLLIISVLISATSVGISTAQRSAKTAKSRDTARQVATAWSVYLLDNRSFPDKGSLSTKKIDGTSSVSGNAAGGPYFPMNNDNMAKLNGKGKSYLEFSNKELEKGVSKAVVSDAWGNAILFTLDFDYNGKIDTPAAAVTQKATQVNAAALALSYGDPRYKGRKNGKWVVAWQ